MLDMGEAVSILTVAENMIRLSGKRPYQDIDIVITGRRPGEKLHESLCAPGEEMIEVGAPNIFGLRTRAVRWEEIQVVLDGLGAALRNSDKQRARTIMEEFCSLENRLSSTGSTDESGAERQSADGPSAPRIADIPAANAFNGHASNGQALNAQVPNGQVPNGQVLVADISGGQSIPPSPDGGDLTGKSSVIDLQELHSSVAPER
jgi:hypothetical protein